MSLGEEVEVSDDPVVTNPTLYRIAFENERVRVLEYLDQPGEQTTPHAHPDSVMITATEFDRRLVNGNQEAVVHIPAGAVRWLDGQTHSGHNIGTSPTHTFFVELKEPPRAARESAAKLGPSEA